MSISSATASQAVMDSIRQIVHALEAGSREVQRELGMSSAQLFVLQTLAEWDGLSVGELAEHSRTHQSSVSAVVSRLAEKKLIRREASSEDARRCELHLTPSGQKVLRTRLVAPQQRLLDAVEALGSEKLDTLNILLAEVVRRSGMAADHPPMFFEGKPESELKPA